MHEMGHTAQRNVHSTREQSLMHFGHTAVVAKTPLTNQGNHIQAKFAMRQRPPPFFFGTLTLMIVGAVRLDALVDDQGQVPLAGEGDHVAMAVISHPEGLATLLTRLLKWSQGLLVRRHGTWGPSSHLLSPVEVSLCSCAYLPASPSRLHPPSSRVYHSAKN